MLRQIARSIIPGQAGPALRERVPQESLKQFWALLRRIQEMELAATHEVLKAPTARMMMPGQLGAIEKVLPKSKTENIALIKELLKGKKPKEAIEPLKKKIPDISIPFTVPEPKHKIATDFIPLPEKPWSIFAKRTLLDPSTQPVVSAGRALATITGLTKPGKKEIQPQKIIAGAAELVADFTTHPLNKIGKMFKILTRVVPAKDMEMLFSAARRGPGKVAKKVMQLPGLNKLVKMHGKTPEDVESFFNFAHKQSKTLREGLKKKQVAEYKFSQKTQRAVDRLYKLEPDRRRAVGIALETKTPQELQTALKALNKKLPVAEYKIQSKAMIDEYSQARKVLATLKPSEKYILKGLRSVHKIAGRGAVREKLISPETFAASKESYVRRLYERFEHPEYAGELEKMRHRIAPGSAALKLTPQLFKARGAKFEPKLEDVPGLGKKTIEKLKNAGIKTPGELAKLTFKKSEKLVGRPGKELTDRARDVIRKKEAEYAAFRLKAGELGPEFAGYKTGVGVTRTFAEAQKAKLFRQLNASEDVVKEAKAFKDYTPDFKVNYGGHSDLAVVKSGGKDWLKMPDDKKFGALANQWMQRWDAKEILQMHKVTNVATKMWDKAIGVVKAGKVIWSPAAQGRNMISNTILMHWSGIPLEHAVGFANKGRTSVLSKDKWYQRYINFGGKGRTFGETEFYRKGAPFTTAKPELKAVGEPIKTAFSIPGRIYTSIEESFKVGAMRYWSEVKGLPHKQAFAKAQEALFDYAALNPFLKHVRRWYLPFVAFTAKALPFTAKTAMKHPERLAPYLAMKDVWNDYMVRTLNISETDFNIFKEQYGEWSVIVGGDNKKFDRLDLAYIIPGLADLTGEHSQGLLDVVTKEFTGKKSGIPQSMQPSQFWLPFLEVAFNKSQFWGKEIAGPGSPTLRDAWPEFKLLLNQGTPVAQAIKSTFGESSMAKKIAYLVRALGPANPLFPGSYQHQKIASAVTGKPLTWSGDVMTPGRAAASIAGIKVTPTETRTLRGRVAYELKKALAEQDKKLWQIKRNEIIKSDPKLRAAMIKAVMNRKKRLIRQWREKHVPN